MPALCCKFADHEEISRSLLSKVMIIDHEPNGSLEDRFANRNPARP
jgi:hypothetical protein